ncbi:hypothetical protein, partial [Asaia sp. SF2.1]|uniref:hypothetical protein n=1 Tax=Asaia sp. SF2.1 TaxID=406101 RepID=UPI001F3C46E8
MLVKAENATTSLINTRFISKLFAELTDMHREGAARTRAYVRVTWGYPMCYPEISVSKRFFATGRPPMSGGLPNRT